MKKPALASLGLLLLAAVASGCPEQKEAVDAAGSVTKAQVDLAQDRLKAAEKKLEASAAEAAAALE